MMKRTWKWRNKTLWRICTVYTVLAHKEAAYAFRIAISKVHQTTPSCVPNMLITEPLERNLFVVVLLASGWAAAGTGWQVGIRRVVDRFLGGILPNASGAEQHFASTHPPPPSPLRRCCHPPRLADSDCKGGFKQVPPRPKHYLAKSPCLNK